MSYEGNVGPDQPTYSLSNDKVTVVHLQNQWIQQNISTNRKKALIRHCRCLGQSESSQITEWYNSPLTTLCVSCIFLATVFCFVFKGDLYTFKGHKSVKFVLSPFWNGTCSKRESFRFREAPFSEKPCTHESRQEVRIASCKNGQNIPAVSRPFK